MFWNSNTINVSCESPLSKEQVKIGWADDGHMHSTRHKPGQTEKLSDYNIVFDRHATGIIGNEYGPNGFFITYSDKFYYTVEQMKLNWHFQHDYNFCFYKKGDNIFIKGDIVGEDEMKFDEAMKEIDSTTKYR